MNNLKTEIQGVFLDEHQGSNCQNLSKTLVYAAEGSQCEDYVRESLHSWLARHVRFMLNRSVVQEGKTPFKVLFNREKGSIQRDRT